MRPPVGPFRASARRRTQMNAEPIRELHPQPGPTFADLAMIEFHAHAPAPRGSGTGDCADEWLEGQSSVMERLRIRATNAGREGHPVVAVYGEPGSGKLRVAQWIHNCSHRANRVLMVLDASCPSARRQLERAAAMISHPSESRPGTLVIRNLQEATPDAIQRLLEILTMQGVELRCGIILLTTEDVGQLRARSLQHGQLLGRAGNAVLHVPPIRTRPSDVKPLVTRFVHEAAKRYGKSVRGISPQAIARLEAHDFPGNIHELRTMIEQALLRSSGDWLTAECFPGIGEPRTKQSSEAAEIVIRLPGSSLREIEVQTLRLALRLSGGRIVRASELLGITRHALRRKLEKFGLNNLRQQFESNGAAPAPAVTPDHPGFGEQAAI
ncbi:MAG: sigma-54-dependent Fis family transcriptional regulator [Myxococcales bacterium FL481]|nr:MAG: sigma-54-dependent Fis family transcriptional regulator [Myxococcales bacterium FL481]